MGELGAWSWSWYVILKKLAMAVGGTRELLLSARRTTKKRRRDLERFLDAGALYNRWTLWWNSL